ncbi:MAK10-like protein [Tanacetum coccineum]
MGDANPIRTLGDYSKLSMLVIVNIISSTRREQLCIVFDPTSKAQSGWKDRKTLQRYLDVPTTSWRIFIQSMDSFQGLTTKGPSPQPQELDTTFEARVRDYMATHTERMKRIKNTIFKQREEIILTETETEIPVIEVEKIKEVENKAESKSIKSSESEEAVEAPSSQLVAYYLKHKINEKLIKELVNNNRFNNSRSRNQDGKKKEKEYKVLPGGPTYDAILKKKITKKEDIRGDFEIPCSIKNLKNVNALVDQGSDMNVMPYSTHMKLTDERPAEIDIRLSLASHSYIYPLGIAEDVLVEVAEHIYPVDFMILDIREIENRPFILGTPFLTTAKASIKFDTGTITLRSGKHKGKRPTLVGTKEGMDDEEEVT